MSWRRKFKQWLDWTGPVYSSAGSSFQYTLPLCSAGTVRRVCSALQSSVQSGLIISFASHSVPAVRDTTTRRGVNAAVCCLMSSVCYPMSVVCCLLSVVCCLLSVVWCLLPAAYCLLSAVRIPYPRCCRRSIAKTAAASAELPSLSNTTNRSAESRQR